MDELVVVLISANSMGALVDGMDDFESINV